MTEAIIIAPTGEPIFWTRADTAAGAVRHLLGWTANSHPTASAMWEHARAHGYRLKYTMRGRGDG